MKKSGKKTEKKKGKKSNEPLIFGFTLLVITLYGIITNAEDALVITFIFGVIYFLTGLFPKKKNNKKKDKGNIGKVRKR